MYFVYKLEFDSTSKFYIGVTENLNLRFSAHMHSANWKEKGIKPTGVTIMHWTTCRHEISQLEFDLIQSTWEDNLNSLKAKYIYKHKKLARFLDEEERN